MLNAISCRFINLGIHRFFSHCSFNMTIYKALCNLPSALLPLWLSFFLTALKTPLPPHYVGPSAEHTRPAPAPSTPHRPFHPLGSSFSSCPRHPQSTAARVLVLAQGYFLSDPILTIEFKVAASFYPVLFLVQHHLESILTSNVLCYLLSYVYFLFPLPQKAVWEKGFSSGLFSAAPLLLMGPEHRRDLKVCIAASALRLFLPTSQGWAWTVPLWSPLWFPLCQRNESSLLCSLSLLLQFFRAFLTCYWLSCFSYYYWAPSRLGIRLRT